METKIRMTAHFNFTVRDVSDKTLDAGMNPYRLPLEVVDSKGSVIGFATTIDEARELVLNRVDDSVFDAYCDVLK